MPSLPGRLSATVVVGLILPQSCLNPGAPLAAPRHFFASPAGCGHLGRDWLRQDHPGAAVPAGRRHRRGGGGHRGAGVHAAATHIGNVRGAGARAGSGVLCVSRCCASAGAVRQPLGDWTGDIDFPAPVVMLLCAWPRRVCSELQLRVRDQCLSQPYVTSRTSLLRVCGPAPCGSATPHVMHPFQVLQAPLHDTRFSSLACTAVAKPHNALHRYTLPLPLSKPAVWLPSPHLRLYSLPISPTAHRRRAL